MATDSSAALSAGTVSGPGGTPPSGSPAGDPVNPARTPVAAPNRVFHFHEHAALWFSLGTGLLVMQIGAYLVPAVGTRDAIVAIVLGSVLGAGLLAWTARLGCESGLSSAGLMHATYGATFAKLPVVLNIVQLLGWTTFELVVMRDGTTAILGQALQVDLGGVGGVVATTLLWGAVLTALMAGSMLGLVRRFVSRFGLPLVIVSLLWLSWQFFARLQANGLDTFMNRPGNGSMGLFSAMDLVIAMPVSWLPLVADYARHGRLGSTTMSGTWLGYAVANIWCYALGVMVASTVEPGTELVTALLLAQGGLVALALILLDELDNAYGDAHSGAVSTHSLVPRWNIRKWGLCFAIACAAMALVLPMHSLEPFLLLLSSVFVPLYGVILGALAGRAGQAAALVADPHRRAAWPHAALWIAGIGCYHVIGAWAPQAGAALPTLALTFIGARLLRGLRRA